MAGQPVRMREPAVFAAVRPAGIGRASFGHSKGKRSVRKWQGF